MRAAASIALAAALATGLAGCQFVSPQWTTHSYSPSDGIEANLGDVAVRNAFLVTDDGTSANLIVSLVNEGSSANQLTLRYTDSSGSPAVERVAVPAGVLLNVRPGAEDTVTLENIKATPGSLFQMVASARGARPRTLQVPVLTTSLPGYGTLAPTPSITSETADTADPTDTPDPDASESPAPDESDSPSPDPSDSADTGQ